MAYGSFVLSPIDITNVVQTHNMQEHWRQPNRRKSSMTISNPVWQVGVKNFIGAATVLCVLFAVVCYVFAVVAVVVLVVMVALTRDMKDVFCVGDVKAGSKYAAAMAA